MVSPVSAYAAKSWLYPQPKKADKADTPQTSWLEGGLLRHSDFLPKRTVHGDHAFPEDGGKPVEIFDVVIDLVHEHILEVLDIGQEENPFVFQIDANTPTKFFAQPEQGLHGLVLLGEHGQLEPDAFLLAQRLSVIPRILPACRFRPFVPQL